MENFNHSESQPFYNTIALNEIQWADENEKAEALQKQVQRLYEANPGVKITPYMVLRHLEKILNRRLNLNSVRRSITNLKNDMVIDKYPGHLEMKIGEEGKPEHYYFLRGTIDVPQETVYKKGEKSAAQIANEMLSNSQTGKIHLEFDE